MHICSTIFYIKFHDTFRETREESNKVATTKKKNNIALPEYWSLSIVAMCTDSIWRCIYNLYQELISQNQPLPRMQTILQFVSILP